MLAKSDTTSTPSQNVDSTNHPTDSQTCYAEPIVLSFILLKNSTWMLKMITHS